MVAQLRHFGAAIYWLIGLLILLGVGLLVLIATWTGVRMWLGRRRQRRSEADRHRERFGPDGQPYPPAARGLCDRCGAVHAKVYHLPDGTKLCPDHYRQEIEG